MKKTNSLRGKFALTLLLVPALFLPSCGLVDWIKGKKDHHNATGKAVVSMAGKVVITDQSFEQEFDQLIEENPHLKSVIALMPDAKKNFLAGMVNQAVVDTWVTENKIDQKAEYQKELGRMMHSVKRMLNTKYFGQEHPVQVSEAELTEFYEKNKDVMPDLMISRGGVKAAGVSFTNEADAKAFVAKVKETKNIEKAAQGAKVYKNYRDFKLVNAQSLGMDAQLRDKIAAMSVPSVQVVKAENKFWVVNATAKEAVQYRPLEQVRAGLEQYVAKEKRMELFDKEINKLKEEYHVVINEDVIKASDEATRTAQDEQSADVAVAQNDDVDNDNQRVASAENKQA